MIIKHPTVKKRIILLPFILLLLATTAISAKDKVITNPVYDFTTSGITNVSKIELNKDETRVHIHSTFLPNWWVKFSMKDFLQDCETGKKYYATNIEKGEFDKEIFMPASGDSTFVLIFPKLPKSVRKVNFGDDDVAIIFGISLNPKEKAKSPDTPQSVLHWINDEVANSKQKEAGKLSAENFLSSEPARIVGYIRGYDERSGMSTGIIYAENIITNEDFPTVVAIHPDGRFEATLPMAHPISSHISLGETHIPFYIEPGQTLAIVLDWDDYLKADRYRDREYEFVNTQYIGPAARINQELMQLRFKSTDLPRREMYQKMSEVSPAEFMAYLTPLTEEYAAAMEKLFKEENISAYTQRLVKNSIKLFYAQLLLDIENDNKYREYQGKEPYEIPSDYFDFLHDTPLDDCVALATRDYGVFINRFEFSTPVYDAGSAVYDRMRPTKSFTEYLFEELGLPKNKEDEEYLQVEEILNKGVSREEIEKYSEVIKAFNERYESYTDAYWEKYTPKRLADDEIEIAKWALRDSAYTNVLNLQPSLSYEISKIRSLNHLFRERLPEQEGHRVLEWIRKDITNAFLIQQAEELYASSYQNRAGYELPANDKGAELFKSIVEPFKGKYVFVDFWGIYCGPCIYGIEQMKETRKSYENSEDAVFVFITSDRESPLDRYNKVVEEQELINTNRLPYNDYLYLRQLFRFNAIPRYVLVSREGRILNENFPMHNFTRELQKLLEKEQKQ